MDLSFFDAFPALETARLLLRELNAGDGQALFAVFADDEVTRFYNVDTMDDVAPAQTIIARMRSRYTERVGIRWAIVDKADGRLIGTIGFNAIDASDHRAVVGYELARRAWGRGFATEALSRVVQYGHAKIGLNRIEAAVMKGNEASVRVLRKVGFEEEGILRAYGYWKAEYHDLRIFSILRLG
jgi:ribosomal-protein-alanine N-acetyltransferase